MPRDLFQNRFLIPSARAAWHDYNGGIYFVTICTAGREHYFGEIINGEMRLSEIGRYIGEQFRNVQTHYPYAEIPLWVIMPNHVHAIVVIDGDNVPYERRQFTKITDATCRDAARHVSTTDMPENHRNIANMQGWLSVVIGGLKSSVTKFANQNNIPFAWQTRFHDHIIRHTDEMNRIVEYIETNVLRWESDEFYN